MSLNTNNISSQQLVFSGMGHSSGAFKISNTDIEQAIEKDYLVGFSKDKILASKNYAVYKEKHPSNGTFEYFAGYKMGFHNRHHVTPFPPTRKKLYYAETSLDLAISAVKNTIDDSGIHPEQFGAWFVSTVSPHEQAPGIAATLKAHFVRFSNQAPTFTLASGCSGFNENIERAKEYFKAHPEVNHVVLVHTETMSAFLTNRVKFVPFVTFGDGAAAIVLSRANLTSNQGLLEVVNYQDQSMLDFVGVDKKWNLYMDDSIIKDRAIVNLPIAAREVLKRTGWQVDDIDLFIPHQTGNAILLPAANELGIPHEKVFLEEQYEYGNTSGATVAIGLSMLNQQKRLKPGMKILSAMAGVGGSYGAFTYVVPKQTTTSVLDVYENDLKGKTVLVLGSSGHLGKAISKELLSRGANLILHYNSNTPKIPEVSNKIEWLKADFTKQQDIDKLVSYLHNKPVHYAIHAASSITYHHKVNYLTALEVFKNLLLLKPECILIMGHAAEDQQITDMSEYLGSVRALHGAMASASGEFFSKGVRLVYYMPGLTSGGITLNIDAKQNFRFRMSVGQSETLQVENVARKIIKSLYIPKVANVQNSYENTMVVRRDGYKLEVDV